MDGDGFLCSTVLLATSLLFFTIIRYDFDGSIDCGKGKKNYMTASTTRIAAVKKMRLNISPLASSATLEPSSPSRADFYKEVRTVFVFPLLMITSDDFGIHFCCFSCFEWVEVVKYDVSDEGFRVELCD